MTKHKILVIDDHELFRLGLKMMLPNHPKLLIENNKVFEVIEAASISQALQTVTACPCVILLDIQLPRLNGIDGIELLQRRFSDAKIIILSGSERRSDIERAAASGARGFINKSAPIDIIINTVNGVIEGRKVFPNYIMASSVFSHKKNLTSRQLVVLALICEGKSNSIIAGELNLSENTVRNHVAAVLSILDVNSRSEAMVAARTINNEINNNEINSV
jgi:two-component system nitrate/nitrite response regulator NarL